MDARSRVGDAVDGFDLIHGASVGEANGSESSLSPREAWLVEDAMAVSCCLLRDGLSAILT